MKGVILAGGHGTRLRPATLAMNKHMVPVLNEPMILYPLRTLKRIGVDDIMIVSGGDHIGQFAEFLGDGSQYDVKLTYRVQKDAGGIAQALGLAEDFARGAKHIAVILGDNIYDNGGLAKSIGIRKDHPLKDEEAAVVLKKMKPSEATRFGVLIGSEIVEKPTIDKLDESTAAAVTGLYIYPSSVFDVVKTLKPSARGELEITDVNNHYLRKGDLYPFTIDSFWSDAGTPESMYEVVKWAFEHR